MSFVEDKLELSLEIENIIPHVMVVDVMNTLQQKKKMDCWRKFFLPIKGC